MACVFANTDTAVPSCDRFLIEDAILVTSACPTRRVHLSLQQPLFTVYVKLSFLF